MQKSSSNPQQNASADKTREQVMAEREAKKQAKLAKKQKSITPATTIITEVEQTTITQKLTTTTTTTTKEQSQLPLRSTNVADPKTASQSAQNSTDSFNPTAPASEKTREQIKAEREAKKAAKQAAKSAKSNNVDAAAKQLNNLQVATKIEAAPAAAATATGAAATADHEKVGENLFSESLKLVLGNHY